MARPQGLAGSPFAGARTGSKSVVSFRSHASRTAFAALAVRSAFAGARACHATSARSMGVPRSWRLHIRQGAGNARLCCPPSLSTHVRIPTRSPPGWDRGRCLAGPVTVMLSANAPVSRGAACFSSRASRLLHAKQRLLMRWLVPFARDPSSPARRPVRRHPSTWKHPFPVGSAIDVMPSGANVTVWSKDAMLRC